MQKKADGRGSTVNVSLNATAASVSGGQKPKQRVATGVGKSQSVTRGNHTGKAVAAQLLPVSHDGNRVLLTREQKV